MNATLIAMPIITPVTRSVNTMAVTVDANGRN